MISAVGCSSGGCHTFSNSREEDRRKRPAILWSIGITDILSGILYTVLLFRKAPMIALDVAEFIWSFFSIPLRLLMGCGLIKSLQNGDDSHVIWSCKMWSACQVIFCVEAFIRISNTFQYVGINENQRWDTSKLIYLFAWILFYRVVCMILMTIYIVNLKKRIPRPLGV